MNSRSFLAFLILCLTGFTLAGCGSSDSDEYVATGTSQNQATVVALQLVGINGADEPGSPLSAVNLQVDETEQVYLLAVYSDGSSRIVGSDARFTNDPQDASGASIVQVSASGLLRGLSVGQTNLVASFAGRTLSVPVIVADVTSISASADNPILSLSYPEITSQILVTETTSSGTQEAPVGDYSYQSSSPSVANVSASGQVTAIAAGTTTITVTNRDDASLTSQVEIEVRPRLLTGGPSVSLDLQPKDGTISSTGTARFSVELNINSPDFNVHYDVTRDTSFSISNRQYFTIVADGRTVQAINNPPAGTSTTVTADTFKYGTQTTTLTVR